MIRIIVRTLDGSPTKDPRQITYKTFDIEAKKLEEFMSDQPSFGGKDIVGVEILNNEKTN